jgi:hypothetical protein
MYNRCNFKNEEFCLPISICEDSDYHSRLGEEFEKYKKKIEQCSLPEENKAIVEENCKKILEAIKFVNNAEYMKAQNNIKGVLERCVSKKNDYLVAPIYNNYAFKGCSPRELQEEPYKTEFKEMYAQMYDSDILFYRGRKSTIPLTRVDMLHIPFSMRRKIQMSRFGIEGVPCFYFSTSSVGVWIEQDTPDMDELYISQFDVPKDLKILNLCINTDIMNGLTCQTKKEKEQCLMYLQIFPLVIATSFVVMNKSEQDVFKSEYIVSQLVMQVVSESDLDGVAYLSKKMTDKFAYPQAVNLAILMKQLNDKDSYCSNISEYKMTKPITLRECIESEEYRTIKENDNYEYMTYVNKFYRSFPFDTVVYSGVQHRYLDTCFSTIDEVLCKEKKEEAYEVSMSQKIQACIDELEE